MTFQEKLSWVFGKYGFELTDRQKGQFEKFYNLLKEWNEKINLTSIVEEDDVIIKHFLDSVLACKIIKDDDYVLDLGTGAGFPGIPLKIMNPEIKIVFVDSVDKKLKFVQYVIDNLGLNNSQVIHTRAEDLGHQKEYREKFSCCVSRAVAELKILLEYCLPFVKVGGKFIAYKSLNVKEEIDCADKALFTLGGKVREIKKFNIEDNERNLVVVNKVEATPNLFPRGKNKPRLSPIE